MKQILAIIVLSLCFITPSQADDINDFEIDGMSIGDSLLEYFSESKITSLSKLFYPSSDKFYGISFYINKSDNFDAYSFSLKKNDEKYIIYDLGGIKEFPNDLESCKSLKDTIVESFEPSAKNFKYEEYEYVYKKIGSGKSISYISSYKSSSGAVRVYCTDWSKATEEMKSTNYIDSLSVDIASKLIMDWLNYEAH